MAKQWALVVSRGEWLADGIQTRQLSLRPGSLLGWGGGAEVCIPPPSLRERVAARVPGKARSSDGSRNPRSSSLKAIFGVLGAASSAPPSATEVTRFRSIICSFVTSAVPFLT